MLNRVYFRRLSTIEFVPKIRYNEFCKYIIETVNHFACFDYMIKTAAEQLSEDMIQNFHRILKTGTSDARKDWFNVGGYKARPNVVGDIKTTAPPPVPEVL